MPYIFGGGKALPAGVPAGGWQSLPLGQDMFWMYPTTYIEQTGAAVEVALDIPFNFKLIAILLEHTDSSDALSTDALTWSFNVATRVGLAQNFPIVSYTASVTSQFLEIFGDDFVYPQGGYVLSMDTTNTDRVRVVLVLQRRDRG